MAIRIVSYDLKKPGRDYQPLYDYLANFDYCWELESVWLLDTTTSPSDIIDDIKDLIDSNDSVFVGTLKKPWASRKYECGKWLKSPARAW